MAATLTVEQEQVSKSHSGDAAHYGLPATLADGRDAVFVPVAPSHLSRFRDRDRAIEWSWRACEKDDPCFFSRPVCLSTTCSVERSNDLGIGIVYDRATGYRFSKERDRYINREIDIYIYIYIYIDREREREREGKTERKKERERETGKSLSGLEQARPRGRKHYSHPFARVISRNGRRGDRDRKHAAEIALFLFIFFLLPSFSPFLFYVQCNVAFPWSVSIIETESRTSVGKAARLPLAGRKRCRSVLMRQYADALNNEPRFRQPGPLEHPRVPVGKFWNYFKTGCRTRSAIARTVPPMRGVYSRSFPPLEKFMSTFTMWIVSSRGVLETRE